MVEASLCHLRITSREAISLLSAVAEDAAAMLGVPAVECAQLGTLTHEVAEAVVRDAFDGAADVDLDLAVERSAGGFTVVLTDHGAPLDFGKGGYPPRVADLVRLGFADGLDISYEPRRGNRSEIRKNLTYASLGADAEFAASVDAESAEEIALDENGELLVDIRPMTDADVVGVARLFYRCYGYSAAYASLVYEPDRLAEYVEAGLHFATIAVTPSGRVVGHLSSEVEDPQAVTGRIGMLAVDPAYRRHHLAMRIGMVHITRLIARGIIGQFTEAVTVHLGSQRTALAGGAHEVGLMLAGQTADLEFQGFDSTAGHRKSVLLYYGGLEGHPHRSVYAPPAYADIVSRIYDETALPRTIHSAYDRQAGGSDEDSRFTVALSHETGVARIWVETYGEDFLTSLQQQVAQLQLNRYELILVHFPLGDPGTSLYASGLQELGLSFCGVYPEYRDGDCLVLQSLNNVDVDPDSINVASELGAYMKDFVIADYHRAFDIAAQRSRSRARMARIYEALD